MKKVVLTNSLITRKCKNHNDLVAIKCYKNVLTLIVLFFTVVCAEAQNPKFGSEPYKEHFYFEPTLPKYGSIKQVDKHELTGIFKYAKFYESQYSHKLYLHFDYDILQYDKGKLTELKNTLPDVPADVPVLDIGIAAPDTMSGNASSKNPLFVWASRAIPMTVKLPYLPRGEDRLQELRANRPNFNFSAVLSQLNEIGLERPALKETLDRLYINDEDKEKLLVLWFKNHKLYVNLMSNQGKWLLPEPRQIHSEVMCFDQSDSPHQRKSLEEGHATTEMPELSCLYADGKYYIGYTLRSWSRDDYFNFGISTCHVVLLNSKLDIQNATQIPRKINMYNATQFGSEHRLRLYKNGDVICAVMQSSEPEKGKIFVQCFNKDLYHLHNEIYLTESARVYSGIIPVVKVEEGFLLSYLERQKNRTDLYTQFISHSGVPSQPVKLHSFELSEGRYASNLYAQIDSQNTIHYFTIEDDRLRKTFLAHYTLPLTDYWKNHQYTLSAQNWTNDHQINWVQKMIAETDEEIATNHLTVYSKKTDSPTSFTAYVDESFSVLKLSRIDKSSEGTLERTFYYDENKVVRYVQVVKKKPNSTSSTFPYQAINAYFNENGHQFWEVQNDETNSPKFTQYDYKILQYINNGEIERTPYELFHDTSR